MKRYIIVFVLIGFLFNITACAKKAADEISGKNDTSTDTAITVETETKDLLELSEKLTQQMAEGDFDETYDSFSLIMKAQSSAKSLKEAWNATISGMGDYVKRYDSTEGKEDKYDAVDVILQYENNGLKVSFYYNQTGKLDGLWFKPYPIEADAVDNASFEEIKITIGEGQYPITGILTIPKNVTHPPVAILVPGSGTHDMNELVGANKPFQDMAWGLAEQGIASIRYNERLLLYPDLAKGEITIQLDSLDDVAEAINYAIHCEQINKNKIYILGHSLGGMMAPKIASDHKEVAGIVMLAGSPRKLEDISYDQVVDALNQANELSEEQKKSILQTTETERDRVKNVTEANSTELLMGAPTSYWYSLNQIDIPKLASQLTVPIFIAQGSADWQVYADKDYLEWQKIFKGKENVTFQLYDNLNHLFMTSNGKTDISEYDVKGNVDTKVISDIAYWINKN
jgi:uncharacterized protein